MRGAVKCIGFFLLFALTLSFSLIPAQAHLAKDEVQKYGAAGTSLEQDQHSHPHNRIIWYEPESSNYTGSLVDRYEQTLSNYTIPAFNIEPVVNYPENFEDVPFTVMFEVDEVSINCPTGQNNPHIQHVNSHIHKFQPHKSIIYTQGHDLVSTQGLLSANSNSDIMYLINGTIDRNRGIAHLEGIIDHSKAFCHDTEPLFTFDIFVNCDGSSMNLTARDPGGYSIIANDEQTHASCIY